MTTETVTQFADALSERGVGYSATTTASFDEDLAATLEEPAVGAPLGIDGVSLSDHPITLEPTPNQLQAAATGVTPVSTGIAAHGTVVVPADKGGSEPVSLYPPKHVAVLRESDLLADVPTAADWLATNVADERESAVFATGASATGDMGALVEGVHGPETVHVLLLTDR